MSQQSTERDANLRTLLEQHWLHCRHLENERTAFLLAYIGSVASILGFVSFRTGLAWTIMIPTLLTLLALLLCKRWSDAFEQHRGVVNKLMDTVGSESGVGLLSTTMTIHARGIFKIVKTRHIFYLFYLVILVALVVLCVLSWIQPELLRLSG